jgi:hypothetical protein
VDEPPQVHRIGGKRWKTLRRKTEEAIEKLTRELVELYAEREVAEGHAFAPDTKWQREMEASFLYEDTPDQARVSAEVKRDMESRRPMDRLVCGDVGFGKTEVAIRAAFKAVQDGKQVAVLAPTTILVEQHRRTFEERLADFPVRVGGLSRFRSQGEIAEIVAGLLSGEVDIVIGTHRLLSQDIRFQNLGLLIIDEEQRFGVKHKEKLKKLRASVDVLTLTATPIPRTLQFSLAGLRNLSLIRTPPRDRLEVHTESIPWSDGLLAEIIGRELDRGGQVYFLHNRVETIDTIAQRVHRLVPHARVAVAHGQMGGRELDVAMRDFIEGRDRRPGLLVHRGERARRPERQYPDRGPGRPVRPGAALPDPGAGRPLRPQGLVLPHHPRRNQRRGPAAAGRAGASHRARERLPGGASGPGAARGRKPPGRGPVGLRPRRGDGHVPPAARGRGAPDPGREPGNGSTRNPRSPSRAPPSFRTPTFPIRARNCIFTVGFRSSRPDPRWIGFRKSWPIVMVRCRRRWSVSWMRTSSGCRASTWGSSAFSCEGGRAA